MQAHQDFRLPVWFRTEEEFHGYFDRDLTDDERADLFAVVIRLRRILNWDPQTDDQDLLDKRRGQSVVRSALSHYATWKEFIYENAGRDSPRLQHFVLYSLSKLCCLYWVRDSGMVGEVLREMFLCDGHFSGLFAHIVSRFDRRSFWEWRNNVQNYRMREDSASIYIVHHAHKAKLRFFGDRFVDMRLRHPLNIPPSYLAAIYSRPQLLLHLLNYGAKMEFHDPSGEIDYGWNIQMLLRHLIRILWNALGADIQSIQNLGSSSIVMSNSMSDVVECLGILLRVLPQIRMDEMNFQLMEFNRQGMLSGSFSSHEFIRLLSETGLVPKFINRYMEPSDLQHLCRCSVRQCLNQQWNLPFGIEKLPLPTILKRYTALEFD